MSRANELANAFLVALCGAAIGYVAANVTVGVRIVEVEAKGTYNALVNRESDGKSGSAVFATGASATASQSVPAPDGDAQSTDQALSRFFDAIAKVETGGEADPDSAVGDKGASLGRYQIGYAYWSDANRLDTGFPTLSIIEQYERDVRNPATARNVMLRYWMRWCPEALAARDWRTLARYHGCGATSARKGNGDAYADKVMAAMD